MPPSGRVGSAFVGVGLDLSDFRHAITSQLPQYTKRAGDQSATEWLKAMKATFTANRNSVKEAVAKQLVTKDEARKLGQQAGREFNAAILAELDRMRKGGQENTAEFKKLQGALRSVGTTGSYEGRRVQNAFSGLLQSTKLWIAALSAGAIIAFQRVLRSTFNDLRKFDAALTESLAIMGDVPEFLRRQMAETARSVSRDLNLSAEEAGKAYYYLASAGLNAEQSIAAFPQVAAFAKAGMFDLNRATDLLTDAQSALGLTTKDTQSNLLGMKRVSDVLVRANTLANASVEQFSEALTNRAAAATRLLGKDVEESVAVLAAFADQGRKGAEAGTQLDIVFRDLQTRSIQNASKFKALGIEVFDATGDMRNMADILGEVEKALAGMSDEQKRATITTLGFSDRSVAALLTLIGTSQRIREYETQLRKAGGTTQLVAEKQMLSLDQRLGRVGQQLRDAGRGFAQVIALPVVEFFADVASAMVDTETPLERTIALLRGVNAEAENLLNAREAVAQLRDEIQRLGRDRSKAGIIESGGSTAGPTGAATGPGAVVPQQKTAIGGLSDIELVRRRRIETDRLTAAIRDQDDAETMLRQRNIDAIDQEIQRRVDLKAATEALQKAEAARNDAVERFNIGARIMEIDAEIKVVENESGAFNRQLETIKNLRAERARLAKQLESPAGAEPTTTSEDDSGDRTAKLQEQARAAETLRKQLESIRRERETAARLGVEDVPESLVKRLNEVVQLEARVNQLRDLRKEAGAAAPPGADAAIAEEERRLTALQASFDGLVDGLRRKLEEIPAAVVDATASVAPRVLRSVEPVVTSLVKSLQVVQAAQAEVNQAARTGDRERMTRARAQLKESRDALQSSAAVAARGIESLNLPSDQLKKLLANIDEILKAAGIDVSDLGDEMKGTFEETARSIELVGRGLINVLDTMGKLSNETRQVLTGVIDLAASVGQLSKAESLLGKIGAVGGIAGAAIGIVSAFAGSGSQKDPAEEERRAEFERNTAALLDLTARLRDLGDQIGPFESAVNDAVRTAFDAVDKLTGGQITREQATPRAALEDIISQLQSKLAAGGLSTREFAETQKRLTEAQDALDAFNEALKRFENQLRDDLAIQELEATGTQRDIAAKQLEIELQKQLSDAIEAFGADSDIVKEVLRVQELRRKAAADQLAEEKKRAVEDQEIAKLDAEGKTAQAAVLRQLTEQERELADARKQGASEAELGAIAERQQADRDRLRRDQAQQADELELDLLEKAAQRRGDTNALLAVSEARLLKQYNDQLAMLQDLADAGIITTDRLEKFKDLLKDDLAAALQDAADAAEAAARSFENEIDLELLRAEGLTKEADLLELKLKQDERRRRAEELGLGEVLKSVLDQLDAAELTALNTGGAAGGDAAKSTGPATQVTASLLQGASETSVLNLTSYARSQWEELKVIKAASLSSAASLRRLAGEMGGLPEPARGGFVVQSLIGTVALDVSLPNVAKFDPLTARQTAGVLSKYLARDVLQLLNVELGRLYGSQLRGTGDASR